MAQIIDGKKISTQIKDEVKEQVAALKQKGIDVTLAVIQIGKDPASTVYVGNKKKACEYVGIRSLAYELPEETSEQELLELVQSLNAKEDVDGILVQLPLPKHIDEDKVIRTISAGQRCGWFSSGERRTFKYWAAGLCFLYTGRDHPAFETFWNND